ncbi:CpsD/CapB family tyrosine-protein kinase [Listeria booriae]|uniref:non-specific protein-tyrosine kinase n=2 Tax=Listeria booriae TaxID=1552123 RepID=A0A099W4Y8_9LIST|nr:CpsD/CapB family tyrosine-protein kinase [Listeria booriae]KGL39831.1 protein tyrosine kinase [Listeria booriae]
MMETRSKNKVLFFEGESNSFEAEKIRSIQVNMQFSLLAQMKHKKIMFTSANKGEGKTFCIINVAKEAANQGKKVLLIDLDLHQPRLSQSLLPREKRGLMNIIKEQHNINSSKCIYNISENLYVLPTGILPPNPLGIISSDFFAETLKLLESEFDHIFIDTPPVRVLSDGRVIASLCDGVVMVIRSGITKVYELKEAKDYIDKTGTPIVGAILNGSKYSEKDKKVYAYY